MVSTATNVSSHKQILLYNTYMEEKDFILPLTEFLRRNMLSTNILLIHNFIKRYQTALILDFIVNQKKINHI